uniref:TIDP3108 n=1 Tax=Arundo donax TaxID=35708 RepID=A0A0A8YS74_ARUDO
MMPLFATFGLCRPPRCT